MARPTMNLLVRGGRGVNHSLSFVSGEGSARSRVMGRVSLLGVAVSLGLVCSTGLASAKVLQVPQKFPTIQAAVAAAQDGDKIRVKAGAYCGATIDKRVELVGEGRPRIIGCADGPTLSGARVGFIMPNTIGSNPASGTKISGFAFDGRGVSSANLAPLAFGIYARFAHD